MQFRIFYDRAVLKATLNIYLRQKLKEGLGPIGIAAFVGVTFLLAWLLISGDRSMVTGILAGLYPLVFVFIIVLFLGWHRLIDRQLAAMGSPQALVTLDDDKITVSTDSGSASVPWKAFRELREYPACWLLVMDTNRFVSLTVAGVDPAALEFVRAKIASVKNAGGAA